MKHLCVLLTAFLLLSGPVAAQSASDRLIGALRADGYGAITVSRTLLGRTRIEAEKDGERREIILQTRSGLILRDTSIYIALTEDDDRRRGSNSGSSNSGSSNSGSRNSGSGKSGDDDPKDDPDDDHSGHGGGDDDPDDEADDNSGHGSD